MSGGEPTEGYINATEVRMHSLYSKAMVLNAKYEIIKNIEFPGTEISQIKEAIRSELHNTEK